MINVFYSDSRKRAQQAVAIDIIENVNDQIFLTSLTMMCRIFRFFSKRYLIELKDTH